MAMCNLKKREQDVSDFEHKINPLAACRPCDRDALLVQPRGWQMNAFMRFK